MSEAAERSGSRPTPIGNRAYVLKPSVSNGKRHHTKGMFMEPIQYPEVDAPAETRRNDQVLSGPQKLVATFLLALGLMAAGGAALVSAASPDPSASAAPSASSGASNGSGGSTAPSQHANCPNM
jgi:hypothetical protein